MSDLGSDMTVARVMVRPREKERASRDSQERGLEALVRWEHYKALAYPSHLVPLRVDLKFTLKCRENFDSSRLPFKVALSKGTGSLCECNLNNW